METRVDYVIGSGNHARSYLHRTADGRLIEMPVSWYTENGGYWAMSPGYDRPNQQDFRRAIAFSCMFCHNAYPGSPPAGGRRVPGGAARRHRLPALPRTGQCARGSRGPQGAGGSHSPRDRQPRAFVARAATRRLHAVSPGNHQPSAAQRRRALRTWAVRLPAGPAAHRLLSVLRSRARIGRGRQLRDRSRGLPPAKIEMLPGKPDDVHHVPQSARRPARQRSSRPLQRGLPQMPRGRARGRRSAAEAIARPATCRGAARTTPYTW